MNYTIFADVSIDIDPVLAKREDIRYIPMEYTLGSELHHCGHPEDDEMMHRYYDQLREKIVTRTSQITPYHYTAAFEPYAKAGEPVLYLSLSSGLSNTYESARLAAQSLMDQYEHAQIEVVDTLGATGGMGLLAECACQNRAAGMSLAENAAWLRTHAGNVRYWFMVEDLMYLKRGGRISAATAIMGTALNIKPILHIKGDGTLDTIAKKRGRKMAYRYMVDQFESTFDPNACRTVYICSADCLTEAELLRSMVLEKHPDLTVHITMLSPIIGAHTGPDMLSLIHFGTKR